MKTKSSPPKQPSKTIKRKKSVSGKQNRIHPVVIYPFRQPDDFADLNPLYELVDKLNANPKAYARPITVIDNKTLRNAPVIEGFEAFFKEKVLRSSEVVEAYCVDTCQMWYTGLGKAFHEGGAGDVYWLIPGDFNYGTPTGMDVLGHLHDLPEICMELNQDICVGEIASDHNHPKHLIDTYGTFALLYNWFPQEAKEIRQYTEHPRSEFFALHHSFLDLLLHQRWYAYEQTVVSLLSGVFNLRKMSRFFVGHITDLPEGRETLTSALQQIERTERVLKTLWQERNQTREGWIDDYRILERQSDQIIHTASVILQNLLD